MLINNLETQITTIKQALDIVQGLTKTDKMPSLSYSIPANECKKGSKLRLIAGSVCSTCYALKGNYKRYPAIIQKQYKRLESISNPLWVKAMIFLIQNKKNIQDTGVFRWHDSGDIQNIDHFEKILQVVKATPNIKHWLPTKESQLVKHYKGKIPENLVIRLSGSMIDGKAPIFKNTSTVTTDKDIATCRAFENNGKCGTCRKCWDKDIKNITYYIH